MRRRRILPSTSEIVQAFEGLRGDYNAARDSRYRRRRTGVRSSGSSADYHYRSDVDFLKVMELARDIDRNDCVVGQGVEQACDNILQDGIKLDPDTGDTKLDADLRARWDSWGDDPDECDRSERFGFHDLARLVLRNTIVDGDMVALALRSGQLQLVEAHRLRTPTNTKKNVVHGVLLDERRRPISYWLTRDDRDPYATLSRVSDVRQYPARDGDGNRQVFHVYHPRRYSQTRGVTAFAPIVDLVGMHDDIQFAKLVQQQIVSCFTILRERELDFSMSGDSQIGERETEVLADGSTRVIEGIAPGLEVAGAPGEKLQGFSPNVPNPEWFQHASLVLTLISINLGLPLQVLLLDPTKTNFSGWRGALQQAQRRFERFQEWLARSFHRNVYRWKLGQWIAEDQALRAASMRSNVSIYRHGWNPPRWPYIEPLKDAQADVLRLKNTLISPRRLHAERGRDWSVVFGETIEDNAAAIGAAKRAALELNGEFDDGAPVHWRELLALPLGEGVAPATAEGTDDGEKDARFDN